MLEVKKHIWKGSFHERTWFTIFVSWINKFSSFGREKVLKKRQSRERENGDKNLKENQNVGKSVEAQDTHPN